MTRTPLSSTARMGERPRCASVAIVSLAGRSRARTFPDSRRLFVGGRLRIEPADRTVRALQTRGRGLADLLQRNRIDARGERRHQAPARNRLEIPKLVGDVRNAVAFEHEACPKLVLGFLQLVIGNAVTTNRVELRERGLFDDVESRSLGRGD